MGFRLIDQLNGSNGAGRQKEYVVGVIIELNKALDTISHKLLHRSGIRGQAYPWTRNYFYQYVQSNDERSVFSQVTPWGAPQGPVLGPKLLGERNLGKWWFDVVKFFINQVQIQI